MECQGKEDFLERRERVDFLERLDRRGNQVEAAMTGLLDRSDQRDQREMLGLLELTDCKASRASGDFLERRGLQDLRH